MRKLAVCRKMLHEAINCTIPAVDDCCPKCGAGCNQREFPKRDFLARISQINLCRKYEI